MESSSSTEEEGRERGIKRNGEEDEDKKDDEVAENSENPYRCIQLESKRKKSRPFRRREVNRPGDLMREKERRMKKTGRRERADQK